MIKKMDIEEKLNRLDKIARDKAIEAAHLMEDVDKIRDMVRDTKNKLTVEGRDIGYIDNFIKYTCNYRYEVLTIKGLDAGRSETNTWELLMNLFKEES